MGVFSTKIPSTVIFSLGLLVFLMPFIDIRCNGFSMQKVSGMQVATGFRIEAPGSNDSFMGSFKNPLKEEKQTLSNKGGNPYAIAALVLAIFSLGFAFTSVRWAMVSSCVTGVMGGIALVGLLIDVRNAVGDELSGELQDEQAVVIAVNFTPWFYIAVLAAFTGAFFSFRRWMITRPASEPT